MNWHIPPTDNLTPAPRRTNARVSNQWKSTKLSPRARSLQAPRNRLFTDKGFTSKPSPRNNDFCSSMYELVELVNGDTSATRRRLVGACEDACGLVVSLTMTIQCPILEGYPVWRRRSCVTR